tara:strand:- start:431 stop:598 length:168 start_codon:yes stop_codon:yes gene_type:complete
MIWTPQKLKELKEKGYKIRIYDYDPRFKDHTIEELQELENNQDKESESDSQDKSE